MAIDWAKIDMDALERGSVIEEKDIRAASGERPGTAAYALALLAIGEGVKKHFHAERQQTVTVEADGNTLRVHTNEEQAARATAYIRWGRRKIKSSLRAASGVDQSQLDDTARQKLQRDAAIAGTTLQHMKEASSAPPPTVDSAKKRPGVPGR